MAPTNPLAENICGDGDKNGFGQMGSGRNCNGGNGNGYGRVVGSVCDIPIDRIAAFCHNAV